MQVAVAIVARNEAKYIQECIAFNYLLGFDRIIIILHWCQDNTEELIYQMPDEVLSKVDVIHLDDTILPGLWFQHKAYHIVYNEYKNHLDWLAMFDVDECLWDRHNRSVHELLDSVPDDVGEIQIPWILYGHNNQVLSVPNGSTRLEYFTAIEKENRWPFCKTIGVGDWYRCHSIFTTGRSIEFNGIETQNDMHIHNIPTFERDTVIAHYVSGSAEDWVIRHKRKPWHNSGMHDIKAFINHTYEDQDTRMLQYNDKLKEILSKINNANC